MNWLELRIPPLAVAFVVAALQYALARSLPQWQWQSDGWRVLSLVCAGLGALASLWGVLEFRRATTTADPMHPGRASRVVSSGIYRYSRNPMYLGFALLLAGWSAWLRNPASVACVPCFVAFLTRFQIVPEERVLEQRFGAEYARYRERVRRWL